MNALSTIVLAFAMSTDAFAAAVGRGAANRPRFATAVRNGLVFGVIEAITPILGWAVGLVAAGLVEKIDHWIAFGLLATVGAKMLWEAFQPVDAEDDGARAAKNGMLALVATAVGTSIDAAAVGVGLAFIGANIWVIAISIGFTTFLLTTLGMMIGKAVGARFGKWAEGFGGVALILIGTVILLEHTGVLG